jgi:hypothetical protein
MKISADSKLGLAFGNPETNKKSVERIWSLHKLRNTQKKTIIIRIEPEIKLTTI